MTLARRLYLGEMWTKKPLTRPINISDNHPYIKEYEATLKDEPLPKEEKKKKVK